MTSPFVQLPNSILLDPTLPAQAIRLYGVLLSYCGEKNVCWPGQKTLAEKLGITDRQVRNLLKLLVKAGLVIAKLRSGISNLYTLVQKIVYQKHPQEPISGVVRKPLATEVYPPNNNHKERVKPSFKKKEKGIDFNKYAWLEKKS